MSDDPFHVPFPIKCAVEESVREAQMAICLKHAIPALEQKPIGDGSLSIACYGPSLADTWQDLQRPILSVSGAHQFLIDRGVVPDYHMDMDPRPHKVTHIERPHPDVQYLMASVCHPYTWSILRGFNVKMFHVVSGAHTYEWLKTHTYRSLFVIAGTSVGLGALHIGGVLGYRHFEIHGMDGCYRGDVRHAGPHFGHHQNQIEWTANGRTWPTSKIMMNSNIGFLNFAGQFPFLAVLHGQGLVQDLVTEADLPNLALAGTEKADLVRTAFIQVVVEEVCGTP